MFCTIPLFKEKGRIFYLPDLIAGVQADLDKHVESYDCVFNLEEYNALPEDKKYSYDIIIVQMGPIAPSVLDDQTVNNKNLKWVHSLSAGIDGYVAKEAVKNSPIPLTNAKGAYSDVLGEFIMLGVLYHSKLIEKFMSR